MHVREADEPREHLKCPFHYEMHPQASSSYVSQTTAVSYGLDATASLLLLFKTETNDEQETNSGGGRPHQWTGCSVRPRSGDRTDVRQRSCISFTQFPQINGSRLVRPKGSGEPPNFATVRSEWA